MLQSEGTAESDTHHWRVLDLGYHELRWSDLDLSLTQEQLETSIPHSMPHDSMPHESIQVQCAPLYDLVGLSELEHEQRGQVQRSALTDYNEHLKQEEKIQVPLLYTGSYGYCDNVKRHLKESDSPWEELKRLSYPRTLSHVKRHPFHNHALWIQTPRGEFTPRALLAQELMMRLAPETLIGARALSHRAYGSRRLGILWLREPGRSPLFNITLSHQVADLPFTQGGPLGSHLATLMGVIPPDRPQLSEGLWGVLSLGSSTAAWSLIEANLSSDSQSLRLQERAVFTCEGVGQQALARASLLSDLSSRRLNWDRLHPHEREGWIHYTQAQAASYLRSAWPHDLASQLPPIPLPDGAHHPQATALFHHFQELTCEGVKQWVMKSLEQNHLTPEALKGIWLTGQQGAAMGTWIKRILPSVKVRIAPQYAAHRGAHRYLRSLTSDAPALTYHLKECSPYALSLYDHHEGSIWRLLPEQAPTPTFIETLVEPTRGHISLLLSAGDQPPSAIAERSRVLKPHHLRIYYGGPDQIDLDWSPDTSRASQRDSSSHSLTPSLTRSTPDSRTSPSTSVMHARVVTAAPRRLNTHYDWSFK